MHRNVGQRSALGIRTVSFSLNNLELETIITVVAKLHMFLRTMISENEHVESLIKL